MGVDDRGRRVVDEQVLLRWFRARLRAWPPHQYRMRAQAAEDAAQHQPGPISESS